MENNKLWLPLTPGPTSTIPPLLPLLLLLLLLLFLPPGLLALASPLPPPAPPEPVGSRGVCFWVSTKRATRSSAVAFVRGFGICEEKRSSSAPASAAARAPALSSVEDTATMGMDAPR